MDDRRDPLKNCVPAAQRAGDPPRSSVSLGHSDEHGLTRTGDGARAGQLQYCQRASCALAGGRIGLTPIPPRCCESDWSSSYARLPSVTSTQNQNRMKSSENSPSRLARWILLPCFACLATLSCPAQVVPVADAATLAKYDLNKNGKLDPDELAALQADQSGAGPPRASQWVASNVARSGAA